LVPGIVFGEIEKKIKKEKSERINEDI